MLSLQVTCKLTRKITVKYVLPAEATTLIYTSSGEELRMVQLEDPFVVGDVTMICTTGKARSIPHLYGHHQSVIDHTFSPPQVA